MLSTWQAPSTHRLPVGTMAEVDGTSTMAWNAIAECSAATVAPTSGLVSSCSRQGGQAAAKRWREVPGPPRVVAHGTGHASSRLGGVAQPPLRLALAEVGMSHLAAAVGVQAEADEHPNVDRLQEEVQAEGDAPAHGGEVQQGDVDGWVVPQGRGGGQGGG